MSKREQCGCKAYREATKNINNSHSRLERQAGYNAMIIPIVIERETSRIKFNDKPIVIGSLGGGMRRVANQTGHISYQRERERSRIECNDNPIVIGSLGGGMSDIEPNDGDSTI